MRKFEYLIPETLQDACAEAAKGAKVKLAGIDLLDELKANLYHAEKIVSLHGVAALREIDLKGGRIGAAVTLAELASNAEIRKRWTALAQAAEESATPQIRNRATLGGNLCQRPRCWYYRSTDFDCLKKGGKGCPAQEGENRYHGIFENKPCAMVHASNAAVALVALGASVTIASEKESRDVPIGEFFKIDPQAENILKPGEIVSHIVLADRGWKSAYLEFREKQTFDYPLVSCAVAASGDAFSVVLGAVAPIPLDRPKAAEFLKGKKISAEVAAKAGEIAAEGAVALSQNGYKIQQVKVAVKRALLALAEVK